MIQRQDLRVLFVSNMYPSEANPQSGIFVARQAESLVRAGVDVIVEPIAGSRGEGDYFASRRRIRRQVREHRPHVIHAHYGYTQVAVAGMGVGFVVTLYGDDVNGESRGDGQITLKSRLGILATQTCGMMARRILLQSEAMRGRMWPMLQSRCVVLGSGVDDTLFAPGSMKEARTRLGIDLGQLVLGFVNSGGQKTKRLDLAEATRDELARRGENAHLLVSERVAATEMPWYYRAADVLLMTSDFEGSPNCVKEALSCGLPIVAVPVGDVPQIVTRPDQGRIVRREPPSLASAVQEIIASRPAARVSLLPESLRASSVANRLIDIYTTACQPE